MKAVAAMRAGYDWTCIEYDFGAKQTYAIANKYQVWRLVLSILIHDSFLHLFWNCFSLFMIGFIVEAEFSGNKNKYELLLLLGGLGGNLASAVMRPYDIGVGASGCIFAILGAFAVFIYINWDRLGDNAVLFIMFFGILFFFSLMNALSSPQIDIWTHLGGLAVGLPMGALYLRAD